MAAPEAPADGISSRSSAILSATLAAPHSNAARSRRMAVRWNRATAPAKTNGVAAKWIRNTSAAGGERGAVDDQDRVVGDDRRDQGGRGAGQRRPAPSGGSASGAGRGRRAGCGKGGARSAGTPARGVGRWTARPRTGARSPRRSATSARGGAGPAGRRRCAAGPWSAARGRTAAAIRRSPGATPSRRWAARRRASAPAPKSNGDQPDAGERDRRRQGCPCRSRR